MAIAYKHRCVKCKEKYVLVSYKNRFPICFDCQKADLQGDIKDPKMKKMFDIPAEFYRKNSFLRSIKINYLRFKSLTEKQVDAFNKTVAKLKDDAKNL